MTSFDSMRPTAIRADALPVPIRPGRLEERLGRLLFYSFGPRLLRGAAIAPPDELAPFERFVIPRSNGRGELAATWYPSPADPRGAVLLAHPWLEWGQAYFHRRGRIEALRAAGFHVLTFDLSGFGGSSPPDGFWDRDLEDALVALKMANPEVLALAIATLKKGMEEG